jgi:Ni/Co efflux regulator RcnB
MNRTVPKVMLMTLLAGASIAGATAHPFDNHGRAGQRGGQQDYRGQREPSREWRNDERSGNDWRNDRRDNRGADGRYDGRNFARERFHGGYYPPPRGYYGHDWRRGERLPGGYYARPYVVRDYRDYRLYAPPRDCQWVRVNNDVVLMAITTGIVLDVLHDLYY